MEGLEGSLLHRSGRRVCFSGRVWVFLHGMADWSQTARLHGSHSKGAADPWRVSTLFPAASRAPSSPGGHSQIPGHYYFIQVTLVLARRAGNKPGGAPPRTKWARRERGGGGGPTL